jgi:type II secretory pathway pseudopilin PulG
MKSSKCGECGFVGWADVENCKACGAPMTQHSHSLPLATPVGSANYDQWDEPENPKKGLAVFALVLGIINFCFFGLAGIGGIVGSIVGWVAMKRAKREPWQYGGHGMALAGFVMSIVSVVSLVPIGIIAAIAIPNLLASRRAANEGSAIYSLRQISSAQAMYQTTFGKFGTLSDLAAQNLIDSKLATGTKNGYHFAIELTTNEENVEGYAVTGVPVTYRSTGNRSFFVDETQVLRVADNSGGPATKFDNPLYQDSDFPSTARPRRADYTPRTVY